MSLQELTRKNGIDLTLNETKSFFLGAMSAKKPLSYDKARDELLNQDRDLANTLDGELKKVWDALSLDTENELKKLLPHTDDVLSFLTETKSLLDYFLTALSLGGTSSDSAQSEELSDLIDELEDYILELDEYLSEEKPDLALGEEMKEYFIEVWDDFLNEL